MKKIEKAVRLIKEGKIAPDALEYLTTLKTEFLPRRTSENDVSKLDVLGKLEHSLFRYNELLKAGLKDDAKREGQNFIDLVQYANAENGGVLKGGVSNVSYTWKTEPGACDACLALDGKTFETLDEVPDRPHPNCKCKIEPIEEEPCDCYKVAAAEIMSCVDKSNSLRDDIASVANNLLSSISTFVGQSYRSVAASILEEIRTWDNACGDFARTYNEMLNAEFKYSDKYFHAKANCQASQRGIMGNIVAEALSLFREIEEGTRKVLFEGADLVEQIEDAQRDLEANKFGRMQGSRFPEMDCRDILDKYRPKSLPTEY